MARKHLFSLCGLMVIGVGLSACHGVGSAKRGNIDNALQSAAADAAKSGQTSNSLIFAQQRYNKNPKDQDAMVAYAAALRRAGDLDAAKLVVQAKAREKNAPVPLMAEYANILIASGLYDEAVTIAETAVKNTPGSAQAQQALALALSGLGKDIEAEDHFRTALLRWPDNTDKTPIINNLAMNLAAQGKLAEAKTIMELATGDALTSETYRNNRALLGVLKTEVPLAALPAVKVQAEKLENPTAKSKKLNTKVKMQPIVD